MKKRLKMMVDMCHNRSVCDATKELQAPDGSLVAGHCGCGSPQPTFTRDGLRLLVEFKVSTEETEKKQNLPAERAFTILKGISDEDCRAMGLSPRFGRPEWMIWTELPVPPPPVRPGIQMNNTQRAEDDLTHKLADIVKVCCAVYCIFGNFF